MVICLYGDKRWLYISSYHRIIVLVFVLVSFCSFLSCSETLDSADLIKFGKFETSLYFSWSKKDITIDNKIFDNLTKGVIFRTKFKFYNKFYLYFKFGKEGSQLEKNNESYKSVNPLDGITYGGGVKWVLLPDITFSPAFSLQVEVMGLNANINRKNDILTSHKIDTVEIQTVLMVSKRFGFFEPYLGGKIFFVDMDLTDKTDNSKKNGKLTAADVFLGMRYFITSKLAFLIEGSFVDAKNFSCGLSFIF